MRTTPASSDYSILLLLLLLVSRCSHLQLPTTHIVSLSLLVVRLLEVLLLVELYILLCQDHVLVSYSPVLQLLPQHLRPHLTCTRVLDMLPVLPPHHHPLRTLTHNRLECLVPDCSPELFEFDLCQSAFLLLLAHLQF